MLIQPVQVSSYPHVSDISLVSESRIYFCDTVLDGLEKGGYAFDGSQGHSQNLRRKNNYTQRWTCCFPPTLFDVVTQSFTCCDVDVKLAHLTRGLFVFTEKRRTVCLEFIWLIMFMRRQRKGEGWVGNSECVVHILVCIRKSNDLCSSSLFFCPFPTRRKTMRPPSPSRVLLRQIRNAKSFVLWI